MSTRDEMAGHKILGIAMLCFCIINIVALSLPDNTQTQPDQPFKAGVFLDINHDSLRIPGDSIYYIDVYSTDSGGFVVPLQTFWECAESY